jgi:putative peptidoglycan lipid II flippase
MGAGRGSPARGPGLSLRLAGWLVGGAVFGKVLGFAREVEMARLLGANIVADSFRGALTAVLLPVAPVQSDMLPSVLIPLHRSWSEQGDPAPRSAALAILLTLFATLVAVAVYALAAPWVGVLVGQFDAEARALTVQFVRVMSLAIPASVLSACLSSIEIAVGRSRIATIRASVQNLSMMAGIAIMALAGQPLAIPLSFVVAFNLVAAYGAVTLWREGTISAAGLHPGLLAEVGRAFWRRFRSLLAIPLADQGNILLERLLASGIAVGAVASLDYARTLTESAFYLVSQPIGYVVLTRAAGRAHADKADVQRISRVLLAVGVPASVFIAVFASDIVRVVFARGAFDEHAVLLTTGALRGISLGLWASTLGWVLLRMVNATGRNGAAAVIVVTAYAGNALVNLAAVPMLGTLGLGLGEAARGLLLLGGTTAVLACGGLMLRCLARAAAEGAVLACAGVAICAGLDGSWARLAVGVPVFGLAVAALLALHLPELAARIARFIQRRTGLPFTGGKPAPASRTAP